MTKSEREQLEDIITALEYIQRDAPAIAVYRTGRTEASVSARLLSIISKLKAVASEQSATK